MCLFFLEYTSTVAQTQPTDKADGSHNGITQYRNLIIRSEGTTAKTHKKIASNGIDHLLWMRRMLPV